MLFLRAVVLPILFLGPTIFAKCVQQNKIAAFNVFGMPHFLHPFMIASYVCYYITAFCSLFSSAGSCEGDPCTVCKRVKSKTITCQGNLPKRIRNHLRIQPLILVECSRLFISTLSTYFKWCFLLIPSTFEFSFSSFLHLLLFVVLVSASPAITIILLILILLLISLALLDTIPVTILVGSVKCGINIYFRHSHCFPYRCCQILGFMIAIPAALGSMLFLTFAGFGVAVATSSAFVPLLSEESLPFVACSVLVLYYFWSSYSSFTNKYQNLGLAIFKHYKSYKKSEDIQVTDMTLNIDSTQNALGNQDNAMKIPKELFHTAWEELMPIRESVCVLILKLTMIVSFVLFVFSLVMLHNVSATPVMKALLTFLSGSLPKIVAIYMDGRRHKNIEAMTADEKIPLIVQEYIEGISAVNQGEENSGEDVDEVKLQNVNEENIQLASM